MTAYLKLKPGQTVLQAMEALLNSKLKAVKDSDGNVTFVEELKDSGSAVMTIEEVAALLQKPVSAIREMCKSRAQKGLHPLPFYRVNGKGVRFDRAKVMEWLSGMPERHARPRRTFAQEKKDHPERFCKAAKCLWRVTDRNGKPLKPCPKHPA
ncbi:MAG TPA: helix-turn-helix domain-containing protein [Terriglobales bacterium]|nr:helix-turn-helix domain-containing protein [Terriglobales bacterium]